MLVTCHRSVGKIHYVRSSSEHFINVLNCKFTGATGTGWNETESEVLI